MEKEQPKKISDDCTYATTPFGVFCMQCNTAIGKIGTKVDEAVIRRHHNRKHHVCGSTISSTAKSLGEAIKNRYGNIRKIMIHGLYRKILDIFSVHVDFLLPKNPI